MPPNRQSSASIVRTLSTEHLASFVREGKYPTLTAATTAAAAAGTKEGREESRVRRDQEEKKEHLEAEEVAGGDAKPSALAADADVEKHEEPEAGAARCYWDWPSLSPLPRDSHDEKAEAESLALDSLEARNAEASRRERIISSILAEEAARMVLSTDRIEQRLKEDARALRSKEAILDRIMGDEKARVAVGLEGIEANLRRDAERRRNNAAGKGEKTMAGEEEKEQEPSYWDWDGAGGEKSANVLSAKQAALLSTSRIERNLRRDAAVVGVHAKAGLRRSSNQGGVRGGGKYWEWRTLTRDEERVRTIESILEDERARLLLSSSHVESNLQKDFLDREEQLDEPACRKNEEEAEKMDEDYWDWNATPEDAASLETAPETLTASNDDYWDWSPPSSTTQQNNVRSHTVESILRDEAAREILTANRLEENLKADTWRRAKEEVDGWYYRTANEVRANESKSEEVEESYWDM